MEIKLFEKKKSCCGCSACANICPKNAIEMKADELGFIYPVINLDLCISCGACKKVCAYQNGIERHIPIKAYAAVNKEEIQLEKSASGGIFAALATYFLKNNGIVLGTSLDFANGNPIAHIIKIDKLNQLYRLQGSKYVQSFVEDSYRKTKESLDQRKEVLFSGTPCQIAGLHGYLRKTYSNLWTIDIICHGVPNLQFLSNYLKIEGEKHNGLPTAYFFRDKKRGWGLYNNMEQ